MRRSYILLGLLGLVFICWFVLYRFYLKPASDDIKSNLGVAQGTIISDIPEPYGSGSYHLIEYVFNVNGKMVNGSASVLLEEIDALSLYNFANRHFTIAYSTKDNSQNYLLLTKRDSVNCGL